MKVIHYPDGRKVEVKETKTSVDHRKKENRTEEDKARDKYLKANMGMGFEADVTKTCEYYRKNNISAIYKRPTPIKVVKMSKVHPGMIEEAYFEEKSTTDYVGIYKGKYIDFECKETIHDTIPFHMIREQQFHHLAQITEMGGIGFFLVSFKTVQEVYLMPCVKMLKLIEGNKHPGFKRQFFIDEGIRVQRGYLPSYYIIEAIEEAFKEEFK